MKDILKAKIGYKKLKNKQATVVIGEDDIATIYNDRRRFFKDEYEADRRQLFFA